MKPNLEQKVLGLNEEIERDIHNTLERSSILKTLIANDTTQT